MTTLFVEDPHGNAFRLVHVDGAGWKYAAGWPASAERRSMFRKVAFESKSEPQPKAAEVPADEPLTVFTVVGGLAILTGLHLPVKAGAKE